MGKREDVPFELVDILQIDPYDAKMLKNIYLTQHFSRKETKPGNQGTKYAKQDHKSNFPL